MAPEFIPLFTFGGVGFLLGIGAVVFGLYANAVNRRLDRLEREEARRHGR